jgi:hypothetical protein
MIKVPDGKLLVVWDKGKYVDDYDWKWIEDYHYGYVEMFMKNVTAVVVDVNTARFEHRCLEDFQIIEHLPTEK